MRIHRIAITNFRGVTACEVELSTTGVTIIEGPNEVGKSSLAEAIDLIFRDPHDANNKRTKAVRPVGRDVGPEVEIELTTGPYHVIYSKRWFRHPKTELAILAPTPRNFTAREAHDAMEAILDETLDQTLFEALRVVQGEKVTQGAVGGSMTLIAALDRSAAGGIAEPEAESTLWDAISEEKSRYFTAAGRVKDERIRRGEEVTEWETKLAAAREALSKLEVDGDQFRDTMERIATNDTARSAAKEEFADAASSLGIVTGIEKTLETLRAKTGEAGQRKTNASEAVRARQEKVAALAAQYTECKTLEGTLKDEAPKLDAAENRIAKANAQLSEAEGERSTASETLQRAEDDLNFRKAEVESRLYAARLGRFNTARDEETKARQFVQSCKVTREARPLIEAADRKVTEARVALDVGSPAVDLEALRDSTLLINGISLHLTQGETHEAIATAEMEIRVDDVMVVRVRSGLSTEDLQGDLATAQESLDKLVMRYGLDPSDALGDLTKVLEKLQDAERTIVAAQETKAAALEDLSEEQLIAFANEAKELVDRYPATRLATPPMPESFDDAEAAVAAAREALRSLVTSEREKRALALERSDSARDLQINVGLQRRLLEKAHEDHRLGLAELTNARRNKSDEALDEELQQSSVEADAAKKEQDIGEEALSRLDPTTVRARYENAQKLVHRLDSQHQELDGRRIELQTTMKVKGEEDLQAAIDEADTHLANLKKVHDATEHKAEIAQHLYETFARHRDAARLSYVAPYKEQVDTLARLVFGADVSIEVDPTDFSLVARSIGPIAVSFDWLSTGAREQLSVLARLACAILVNPEGADGDAGVPVILDDALGYTDPVRLKLLAPAFTAAAKKAQVIVMTCTPNRYDHVGDAKVIRLPNTVGSRNTTRDAVGCSYSLGSP